MVEHDDTEIRIEVGIIKTQIATILSLYQKLENTIDKINTHSLDCAERIQSEMSQKREELKKFHSEDMKEINKRVDTLIDKLQLAEMRLKDEIQHLRSDVVETSKEEQKEIQQLKEWRWAIMGGMIVLSWLISHFNPDIIQKILN